MKPIKIIVSPSDGAAVRELIETSTKARLVNLVEGPKDFIDVIEDPKLMGLLKEEGFFTTGSPWKNGTLGCLMKCQDKVYGITCKHVNRTILNTDSPAHHLLCQEVESDGDTFIDACDQKTDFSFFSVNAGPNTTLFNFLPFANCVKLERQGWRARLQSWLLNWPDHWSSVEHFNRFQK